MGTKMRNTPKDESLVDIANEIKWNALPKDIKVKRNPIDASMVSIIKKENNTIYIIVNIEMSGIFFIFLRPAELPPIDCS